MNSRNFFRSVFTRLALLPAGLFAITPALTAQSSINYLNARATVPREGVTCSFRIDGPASKNVLVRAGGALLAGFGVTGAIVDPRLTLTNATTGEEVATNDDWNLATNAAQVSAAAARVGASAYPAGSKDPSIYATLPPGVYTATVLGVNGTTGVALIELFDADTTRVSSFGYVALRGSGSLSVGVTLGGTGSRLILVRAVGPSLGVSGAMADPSLTLFSSTTPVATNNDWGGTASLVALASQVGAPALAVGSKDSAVVPALNAGTSYLAQVGGSAGIVQVEFFDAGPLNTSPTITTAPQALHVNSGEAATLAVKATGSLPLTYQWQKNGVAISGATGASYTIPSTRTGDAGNYSVAVSNSSGLATSAAAPLTVSPSTSRLINLSILTSLTTAGDSFTMGYVVGGSGTSGTKPLVIRAAGPSLGALGVSDTLADPKLELFTGATKTGENDNWGGSATTANAMAAVGAFAYTGPTSRDAAEALSVASGDNSVKVSGVGNGTGAVIAEIYDATPAASFSAATPRLVNVSVLKQLGTGFTAGFVVGGTGTKNVLVRAIGPTLASAFGVGGAVSDPQLTLYSGQTVVASNDNWGGGATLVSAFSSVAAFVLPAASRDAAVVASLSPGNYTVQVSGVAGATGMILVEVYEVP